MSETLKNHTGLNYLPSTGWGIVLALALTAVSTSALALDCDKSSALKVRVMMKELAKVQVEGDHIAVHWTYAFEDQPRQTRLKMTRTFADTDACLMDAARKIHFYRKKKLVGIASPTSGIRLVD